MRPLSKLEKDVVKKLCEKPQSFSNLFDENFLQNFIIEIINDSIAKNNEIKILMKRRETYSDKYYLKQIYEATYKISEIINLLNYLNSEAYIFSFKSSHCNTVHGFIGLKELYQEYEDNPDKYERYIFPNQKLNDIIFEFVDITFVSTEALKDYLKNDFRTPDQIMHRQNIIVAWIAIIISILLGLIGIFCKC
ncbi:MAG: hypothetical protein QMD02_04025 [Bacteroidales bacterium]|nr:hypothetical protein [Bacteroidales bacterium]